MTNPSPAALLANDINRAISCARAVLPLVPEITSAKSKLDGLQTELATLTAQITATRSALVSEKSAWLEEWKKLKADRDRDWLAHELDEKKWVARLDAARASLVAVQNKVGKEHTKLEKIVKEIRRLQRAAH